MTPRLTVAIPTYNNERQLLDTLMSLVLNTDFQGRIIVINNGDAGEDNAAYRRVQGIVPYDLDWIDMGENVGWMRAINEALEHTESELFCMLNDDVLFPPASYEFWAKMLGHFDHTDVGGVGPASNYVAGYQNAFVHLRFPVVSIPYLIGMCAVYRTKILKDLGGLDETLPGGDDLDISIRAKDAGWKILADRRCFLFHWGGQTGRRVKSDWDSAEHQRATQNALIRKHGLRRWYDCVNGPYYSAIPMSEREALVQEEKREHFNGDSVRARYLKACMAKSDINEHLPVLYRYASTVDHVTEMGVDDGTSTLAFLYAHPKELRSYDIVRKPEIDELLKFSNGTRFLFHQQDTAEADIEPTDMLFIDDLHTGEHVAHELARHADKVRRYIFLHDTVLFETRGELPESSGIWPAVARFCREHPEWRICHTSEKNNGLVGLERVGW